MPVRGYPTSGTQLGVYPESGSRLGTYPSGASLINVSQSFGVSAEPMTLSVIDIAQSLTVEASGSTGADIATLPGVVAVWDKTAGVTQNPATITAAQDMSDAAWTKTNLTVTTNVAGTQDRITCNGSAAPTLSQTITNCGFLSASMTPVTISVWLSYETVQYAVMEGRASTAVNRVWLDVQNGVMTTPESGWSNCSFNAETRNSVAGYRFTGDITAIGAAPTCRIQLSTTGSTTFTTPANGTSMRVDDWTVSQVKESAWTDRVGGYVIAASSANTQPGSGTDAAGPYRQFYAGQHAFTTAAAVVAAGAGSNPEFTVHYVTNLSVINATQAVVGWATSTQVNNGSHVLGTTTTGLGRLRRTCISDAAVTDNKDSTNVTSTGLHCGYWFTSSSGAQINHILDGGAADPSALAQTTGTMTCDRFGIGRCGSNPNALPTGKYYAIVVSTGAPDTAQNILIANALKAQFGTP